MDPNDLETALPGASVTRLFAVSMWDQRNHDTRHAVGVRRSDRGIVPPFHSYVAQHGDRGERTTEDDPLFAVCPSLAT
jgi:hypothetical protein